MQALACVLEGFLVGDLVHIYAAYALSAAVGGWSRYNLSRSVAQNGMLVAAWKHARTCCTAVRLMTGQAGCPVVSALLHP